MKKALFFPFFLLLTIPSFADRNIFIEGTAVDSRTRTYFMENFTMEATALRYKVVNNRQEAAYTFRFTSRYHEDEYNPDVQYMLMIALVNNANNTEVLSFGWPYSTLDEMYEYNQYVFVRAVTSIPQDEEGSVVSGDRSWQNRILYLRASFDYPIVFYALQSDGLHADIALYNDDRSILNPLDNKVIARPGATVGLEVQIVRFLAIEGNVQVFWGAPEDDDFINLGVNGQLKIPIAFPGVVVQPYGNFFYPLLISDIFTHYQPPFSVGGGIQAGVKAGKRGSFFVDVQYLVNLDKVAIKNLYGEFTPNPENVYFKRTVIGLAVGYKVGFFERKR